MQRKFMPTDVFLRLEKEWQHMRHAKHNLEIEAVPANDQRIDGINELEPSATRGTRIGASPLHPSNYDDHCVGAKR